MAEWKDSQLARKSRLKGGCGQDWPRHSFYMW
jgi:hypothetical protein